MSWSADLPFVATPPGDIESVQRSAELAAEHWQLPAPRLMRMGMNGIFTAGPGVLLRVSRPSAPAQQAIELAEVMRRSGLRVPSYVRDEAFMAGEHAVFAIAEIAEHGPIDWVAVGRMVARLHALPPADVAASFPLPFCGAFPWWNFAALLDDVDAELDPPSRVALHAAVECSLPLLGDRAAPGHVVCHGDVHPGNVIQSADGPVLLDWDLVCRGPAAWDHAPLMTWTGRWGGDRGIYESFAAGYGRSMRGDPAAEAIAELRLVAATLMRVRAGRSDPSAAAEAELRLRYWRGEADAPQWQAQ